MIWPINRKQFNVHHFHTVRVDQLGELGEKIAMIDCLNSRTKEAEKSEVNSRFYNGNCLFFDSTA